ncbi:hypothetical protein N7532_010635 [Penicillium argentinense]|uniref:NmrA-like domain-containing protein n=1 Tax=Penicillium argentinense TaxID=1131581 RepID=A0A9W9EQ54_9EURO|nr:uncharacterized protein N7532_010635 [Penicillium argentinense]KAJ5085864.1 hypothetical protein N7532_010635 [Penicillium argentinense]
MVKIAIAGGSSNVVNEIIDGLSATKSHDFVILEIPVAIEPPGKRWVKADYGDPEQLASFLEGVHTVLSFVSTQDNPSTTPQKNLINAAVRANVKRFAPSEWASSTLDHLSWYTYKREIRRFLGELNKDSKVLEYNLFQPGMFMNYLTHPYPSAKHVHSMELLFDYLQMTTQQ